METRDRSIEAQRLFGISEVIGQRHLVTVTAGPRLEPIVLSSEHEPDRHTGVPWWATFSRKRAARPNRFRVHHQAAGGWAFVDIEEIDENFSHVAPLGDDRWLLVRGRADGNDDQNAHVHSASGERLYAFHAGDGVQDVQSTFDGLVWISYFDEGVFGDTDLGSSGLVCLDDRGDCRFRFTDTVGEGVPGIADCYALNVVSSREVWLDYYTDFPMVKLVDGKVAGCWSGIRVKGSPAFAVAGDQTLFAGGYGEKETLRLVRLGEQRAMKLVPVDSSGAPIREFAVFGRGNRLFLHTEDAVHAIDVAAAPVV
jgi:hypothetical protein